MKRRLRLLLGLVALAPGVSTAPLVAANFGPNGTSVPSIEQTARDASGGFGRGPSAPKEVAESSVVGTGPAGDEAGIVGGDSAGEGNAKEADDPRAAGFTG